MGCPTLLFSFYLATIKKADLPTKDSDLEDSPSALQLSLHTVGTPHSRYPRNEWLFSLLP